MNYLRFCDILIILNIIFSYAYYLYDIIEYSDMFREKEVIFEMNENTLNMLLRVYRPMPENIGSMEMIDSVTKNHDQFINMLNKHKDCDIHPIR